MGSFVDVIARELLVVYSIESHLSVHPDSWMRSGFVSVESCNGTSRSFPVESDIVLVLYPMLRRVLYCALGMWWGNCIYDLGGVRPPGFSVRTLKF